MHAQKAGSFKTTVTNTQEVVSKTHKVHINTVGYVCECKQLANKSHVNRTSILETHVNRTSILETASQHTTNTNQIALFSLGWE